MGMPAYEKKGISLRTQKMLAAVKEQAKKEKEKEKLSLTQTFTTNYKEKFDSYVTKEHDVLK